MATWNENPDLMARLVRAQNHPANLPADVMTFAGFCDDRAELLRHVEACEARVVHQEGVAAVAAALRSIRKRARRAA